MSIYATVTIDTLDIRNKILALGLELTAKEIVVIKQALESEAETSAEDHADNQLNDLDADYIKYILSKAMR